MPISIDQLAERVIPAKTVLLFGSGSSIPSNGPSVQELIEVIGKKFSISSDGYTLSEIAGLAERRANRAELIECLRSRIGHLRPHGGISNLPLYQWKSIFTTNYDTLIEQSYSARSVSFRKFSSNFDFKQHGGPEGATNILKLHGTIEQDYCDGFVHGLILTESDYTRTSEYRQFLYRRLQSDICGATLLIIGHSLSDPHIKDIVNKSSELNTEAFQQGNIVLFLYQRDENRAALIEGVE